MKHSPGGKGLNELNEMVSKCKTTSKRNIKISFFNSIKTYNRTSLKDASEHNLLVRVDTAQRITFRCFTAKELKAHTVQLFKRHRMVTQSTNWKPWKQESKGFDSQFKFKSLKYTNVKNKGDRSLKDCHLLSYPIKDCKVDDCPWNLYFKLPTLP